MSTVTLCDSLAVAAKTSVHDATKLPLPATTASPEVCCHRVPCEEPAQSPQFETCFAISEDVLPDRHSPIQREKPACLLCIISWYQSSAGSSLTLPELLTCAAIGPLKQEGLCITHCIKCADTLHGRTWRPLPSRHLSQCQPCLVSPGRISSTATAFVFVSSRTILNMLWQAPKADCAALMPSGKAVAMPAYPAGTCGSARSQRPSTGSTCLL